MKTRFSIRYKILAVISLLLAGCVAVYLALATWIFKQDKTELVFDLNRSLASNMATDLETELRGVSSKLDLLAILWNQKQKKLNVYLQDLLEKDPHIVYVALVKKGAHNVQFVKQSFLESYAIKEDYFSTQLQNERPIPFETIQEQGDAVWNASVDRGPPLVGFGRSVIEEGPGHVPVARHAVVCFLSADQLLKNLKSARFSDVLLINNKGRVLLSNEQSLMTQDADISIWPLVKNALEESAVKTSVMNYEYKGKKLLGAYSKSYQNKLIVVAKMSEAVAFEAVQRLVSRSLLFALNVATLAFIVAILFSRSLTKPLQKLLGGMEQVAQGDLDTQIHLNSRDEIAWLAKSFNAMIADLKQSRAQLEEINRELEQKVLDRTRKLEEQNRAVKEAQEALLRTTRLAAVGEIAGRAAHEVLNPLTTLMTRIRRIQDRLKNQVANEGELLGQIQQSWLEEFSQGGFDKLVDGWKSKSTVKPEATLWDEDMENLKVVHGQWKQAVGELLKDSEFLLNESQRINKIVSQMRSLSVVSGDRRAHSIHEVLRESVKIMGDLFMQHSIEVVEKFEAPSDTVRVDRDEMIQCLTNLFRNSAQAISFKGRIEVTTGVSDGVLRIDISDTGTGVSPENQAKLFKAQFTTKKHEEGTGLGLAICRRFIRSFGGDLNFVESNPGVKTVFRITLPLEQQQHVSQAG